MKMSDGRTSEDMGARKEASLFSRSVIQHSHDCKELVLLNVDIFWNRLHGCCFISRKVIQAGMGAMTTRSHEMVVLLDDAKFFFNCP